MRIYLRSGSFLIPDLNQRKWRSITTCGVSCYRRLARCRRTSAMLFSFRSDENLSPLWLIPDPRPEPEEVAEHHDRRRILLQAIGELPPNFRDVVFLPIG